MTLYLMELGQSGVYVEGEGPIHERLEFITPRHSKVMRIALQSLLKGCLDM